MKNVIGLLAISTSILGVVPGCSTSADQDGRWTGETADRAIAYNEAGTYGLFTQEQSIPGSASNRTIKATVCAPANDSGDAIADGRFPLIVISPGAKLSRSQYSSYCEHLATWGFVVVNQSFVGNDGLFPPANHNPLAADVSSIIDWAIEGDIGSHVDSNAIGVAGHSLGGKVSMLAAANDLRIGAVVGWDPVDANAPFTNEGSSSWSSATPERMGDINAPVAVLGETVNARGSFFSPACAPEADNFAQYYEHAVTPSLEVEIFNANHMQWTDSSGCRPCNPCGSADRSIVQEVTRTVTTAWFRLYLLGDASAEAALNLNDEVAAGLVAVRSK